MPWATALSALAAAIGLFFSALVASSSVDATRRQLDQDERQQAGRVGYWTEFAPWSDGVVETITVVNRSLDPVTNVELWWYAPDAGIDPAEHGWVFMGFDVIPPCTRLVFPPHATGLYLRSFFGIEEGKAPELQAIQFVDSDGRQWLRNPSGLGPAEHKPEGDELAMADNGQWLGEVPARREPAEHCDK